MSARQNVIWLGVSGLTLHFMSCACKGYSPSFEIKVFVSNLKQKVLNDDERCQRMVPNCTTFLLFSMTLKCSFSVFDFSAN